MTLHRQCEVAIERALEVGADYADVRVVESSWRGVHTFDQALVDLDRGRRLGIGVRARVRGVWGFASGTDLGVSAVRQLAERAAQLADAGGLLLTAPTPLAAVEPVEAEWYVPVEQDPFAVPIDDQVALLSDVERALLGAPVVSAMSGWLACSESTTTFASSEGSFVVQRRVVTGARYQALAESDGRVAVRSFPGAGGAFGTGGFELVDALDLPGSVRRIRDEVSHLVYAAACPTLHFDHVILSSSAVAAVLHETLGHALELGRFGDAGPPIGESFLSLNDLGHLPLASEHVSIVNDPTLSTGLGSYAYDDEGVPARAVRLVDRGRWVDVLSDRETAGLLGLDASSGSARASGFNRAPIVRMGNLGLEPGDWSLADLIASTESGILIDTPVAMWVDRRHRRFRCNAEIGWRIDGGRLREVVRAPSIEGDALDLFGTCDAVCRDDLRTLWGVTDCASGVPTQVLSTGHATVPARFAGHLVTSWQQE